MSRTRIRSAHVICRLTALLTLAVLIAPAHAKKSPAPTLRWAEGKAGCTFSLDSDGKYRYGLWTADLGVVLAVDAQELQLVHKRGERFFGVHLTVHNSTASPLVVDPGLATLEFEK